jgi:hypothetical protein
MDAAAQLRSGAAVPLLSRAAPRTRVCARAGSASQLPRRAPSALRPARAGGRARNFCVAAAARDRRPDEVSAAAAPDDAEERISVPLNYYKARRAVRCVGVAARSLPQRRASASLACVPCTSATTREQFLGAIAASHRGT